VLHHLGRRQRRQPAACRMARIAHQAEQEAGAEQVTGAGGEIKSARLFACVDQFDVLLKQRVDQRTQRDPCAKARLKR
jgi:hypothetical protein